MSEEFYYSVSFKCDEEAITLLKEVASCMDAGNYYEIDKKLSSSTFSFESDEITALIGNPYYGSNLGKALAEHAEQSCSELGVASDFGMSTLGALKASSKGIYHICAEGTDRDADAFCHYLTIFLHVLGAKDMNAKGSGGYWSTQWSNMDAVLVKS